MGLRSFYKWTDEQLVKFVLDKVTSRDETLRRAEMRQRTLLLQDQVDEVMLDEISKVFYTSDVRDKLRPFLSLSASNNILKRISEEIGRPIYAVPPRRTVTRTTDPDEAAEEAAIETDPNEEDSETTPDPDDITDTRDQATLYLLANEMGLNDRMNMVARSLTGLNQMFGYVRVTAQSKQAAMDLLTPDMVTVIPHPELPNQALGIAYDKGNPLLGKMTGFVYWDDEDYFEVDATTGRLVELPGDPSNLLGMNGQLDSVKANPDKILPVVEFRRRPIWGGYWDMAGKDLIAATKSVMMLSALRMRLHKAQGFKLISASGDIDALAKNMVLDEEGLLPLPAGTTASVLDLVSRADHYTATIQDIVWTTAANYGINRERINLETSKQSNDAALYERTADLINAMRRAESDLFAKLQVITKKHHDTYELSSDCQMSIDYGEISTRTEPQTQLDIWAAKMKMGLISPVDVILELNPEFMTEKEGWDEFDRNLDGYAKYIGMLKNLNAPMDGNAETPGQTPQQNGAMGPMVRDGMMSADDAALVAAGGKTRAARMVERQTDAAVADATDSAPKAGARNLNS